MRKQAAFLTVAILLRFRSDTGGSDTGGARLRGYIRETSRRRGSRTGCLQLLERAVRLPSDRCAGCFFGRITSNPTSLWECPIGIQQSCTTTPVCTPSKQKQLGPVTEDVCKLMAQTLMGERFKMVAHRESREMPVYALVVAKKGPKLKLASEEDSTGNRIVMNGRPMGTPAGTPKDFKAPGWSMENLVDFLRIAVDRPVVNRTGLDGLYRINLNFSISNPNPNYEPPPDAGPDAKTALEEQMGLTLESAKAPVETLIIDRLEKPDAN